MDYRLRLTVLRAGTLLLVCAAGCRRFGNSAVHTAPMQFVIELMVRCGHPEAADRQITKP